MHLDGRLRFSEWSTQGVQEISFLRKEENLIIYYHCLCYFTLFHTIDNHSDVTVSWKTLLTISEETKVTKKIEFGWLNQLIKFKSSDYSKSSYNILLGKTSGTEFRNFNCQNDFIGIYLDVLLFLLFSDKENLNDFFENIAEDTKDSLFYKWIQNESVSLYPKDHNVCMQNLAVNSLIVLENIGENKIFIKGVNKRIEADKFHFVTPLNINNNEFEYVKEEFKPLEEQLDSANFINFISSLNDKINKHKEFRNAYKTNYPVLYNPVFLSDGQPLVPFYSTVENKAISLSGEIKDNNIEYYWDNLLEIIHSIDQFSNIRIVDEDNPFNYSVKNIEQRFFPASELLIKSSDDKVKFIAEFCKNIKNEKVEGVFDFQYFWSIAILDFLKSKKLNGHHLLLEYLNVHFNHYKERKEYILDILFCVTDETEINYSTLKLFFTSIVTSIISFQTQLSNSQTVISRIFDDYISNIEKVFLNIKQEGSDNMKLLFNDFLVKRISYTLSYNNAIDEDENVLKIDNDEIDFNKTNLYNNSINSFEPLTSDKAITLNNKDYSFLYSKDNVHYIYVPDIELIKAFDRISIRKKIYNDLKDGGDKSLFAKNKSLFPADKLQRKAEHIYSSTDTNALENILKNHFNDSTNIKKRIVNWLSLFNEKSIANSDIKAYMDEKNYSIDILYTAIIESLKAHIPIKDEDLEFFKTSITEYNAQGGNIIFPLKHPYKDSNGLKRLFVRCKLAEREIDVDKYSRELFSKDCADKKLIIPADISISGRQASKALLYYLSEYEDFEKFRVKTKEVENANDKYFVPIDAEQLHRLQKNIKTAKEIIFLSPITTKEFENNISGKLSDLGVNGAIKFESSKTLNKEDYLLGEKRFDSDHKKLIYVLLKDRELLKLIFNTDGTNYKNGVKNDATIDARNTLLRIESLPSWHIQLFSLRPKNGSKPLLEYVSNWMR